MGLRARHGGRARRHARVARSRPGTRRRAEDGIRADACRNLQLQRIQRSPDALLLNSSAATRRLSTYTRGKVTLLTFFYTYCTDKWGCPFAYETMRGLRDRIVRDADMRSRVRFVSISFDPAHDTPSALRLMRKGSLADGVRVAIHDGALDEDTGAAAR